MPRGSGHVGWPKGSSNATSHKVGGSRKGPRFKRKKDSVQTNKLSVYFSANITDNDNSDINSNNEEQSPQRTHK